MTVILCRLLRAYQAWISPLRSPCCRFEPTCSSYAIEALQVHGLWRGSWLTLWRMLRCQPFAKAGFDPVPPPDSSTH